MKSGSIFLSIVLSSPTQYQRLYAGDTRGQPHVLDVTGLSIEEVSERINTLVDTAWERPRRSLTETLW